MTEALVVATLAVWSCGANEECRSFLSSARAAFRRGDTLRGIVRVIGF